MPLPESELEFSIESGPFQITGLKNLSYLSIG